MYVCLLVFIYFICNENFDIETFPSHACTHVVIMSYPPHFSIHYYSGEYVAFPFLHFMPLSPLLSITYYLSLCRQQVDCSRHKTHNKDIT